MKQSSPSCAAAARQQPERICRFSAVIAAIAIVSATVPLVQASPASPAPIELRQPDGTAVTLHIRGDEHFHWFEDLQGFTVVRDGNRYVYARLDVNGRLAPTGLPVGASDPVAAGIARGILPTSAVIDQIRGDSLPNPAFSPSGVPQAVPPSGTVKNLVVLAMFSDHAVGVNGRDPADYNTLFNQVGGDPVLAPSGSVRDCFFENSYGTMRLVSTVAPWVTLPQTEAYYANGENGLGGTFPTNPQGMVRDALDLVDAQIDFGQFDNDNDGYVDAISIIHSGYGAETGGGDGNWIWSHRWSLFQLPEGEWISSDVNANGEFVKVYGYHTEPALWSTSGTGITRIGVVVHETGHFFGLPDLYDTNGGGSGIGSFCMMANSWGFDGSQLHPPHFSAWCKDQLGWATPTVITPGTYVAPQAEFTPTTYRIDQGYPPGEYLLIENRQPVGFESAMPQGGLAIWHVDENKCCNTDQGYPGQADWPQNNRHYRIALLQADGNYNLERGNNRGDSGDLWHGGGNSSISNITVPGLWSYQNGIVTENNNSIIDISVAGPNMSFTYIDFEDCNTNGADDVADIGLGASEDCNMNAAPDECDLFYPVVISSGPIGPFFGDGDGSPAVYQMIGAPIAEADVVLDIDWFCDCGAGTETFVVNVNGLVIGIGGGTGGNSNCQTGNNQMVVSMADWNNALVIGGGDITITAVAATVVNEGACGSTSIVFNAEFMVGDGDGNGILDACEGACQGVSGDLNADDLVDGTDIDAFVQCLLTGSQGAGTCGCADMDASGTVDSNDVPLFVTALIAP